MPQRGGPAPPTWHSGISSNKLPLMMLLLPNVIANLSLHAFGPMLALERPAALSSLRLGHRAVSRASQWPPATALASHRHRRGIATETVTDDIIAELAAKPLHPLTLGDLVKCGRPPLSASELFNSANFTLSILPTRLAHRIRSLRNLPFIVVSNPHISTIHNNYLHSLSTLLPWSKRTIDNVEDETEFTLVMADLVQTHLNTISILARGFLETRKYIAPKEVTRFLDEHLRARIGTRLIAEQHISLHYSSKPHMQIEMTSNQNPDAESDSFEYPPSTYIGIIDTQLCPANIIRQCADDVSQICEYRYGVRPSVIINGEPDYTFAHIPVHLEYIITELLKNAFRATVEHDAASEPIEVTIAPLPESPQEGDCCKAKIQNRDQGNRGEASLREAQEAQVASTDMSPLKQSTHGVTIRIRDRGGGIPPETLKHIWDYSFTTFKEEELRLRQSQGDAGGHASLDALNALSGTTGGSSLAGLGYGLPLGRAYAEYFGGGIAVQSLWGWGTDVYLSLRGVGKVEWSNGTGSNRPAS